MAYSLSYSKEPRFNLILSYTSRVYAMHHCSSRPKHASTHHLLSTLHSLSITTGCTTSCGGVGVRGVSINMVTSPCGVSTVTDGALDTAEDGGFGDIGGNGWPTLPSSSITDARLLTVNSLSDTAISDGAFSDGGLTDGALSEGGFTDGALSDGAFSDGAFSETLSDSVFISSSASSEYSSVLEGMDSMMILRSLMSSTTTISEASMVSWFCNISVTSSPILTLAFSSATPENHVVYSYIHCTANLLFTIKIQP